MKYILTDKTKEIDGHILHQIKLIEPLCGMEAGTLGGYVESYSSLSHDGDCWIYDDACVYGEGFVSGDAKVSGNARISGGAFVYESAEISGNAEIEGTVFIRGSVRIGENAKIKSEENDSIHLTGCEVIEKDAYVRTDKDFLLFENCVWLNGCPSDAITFYKTSSGAIEISFLYACDVSGEMFGEHSLLARKVPEWYDLAMEMVNLQML